MNIEGNIYEYHNARTLCVAQDVLTELKLINYNQLQHWCRKDRNKLNRIRTAGNGRTGLIEWASIRDDFRQKIIKAFGDPYRKEDVKSFINRLQNDEAAASFLQKARVSEDKQLQYYTEAQILNLYGELLNDIEIKKARNTGFKKTKAKADLSKVINELKLQKFENGKQKFPHKLPANPRAIERRYKEYKEEGYENLVHGGDGNSSAKKIKGQIADWLLANYCLPNKPTTTTLHKEYMQMRQETKWPSLSESAIYTWLQETKQRKVWVLARHGKAVWINEFGHKVARDKSDWFPNVYMGIDGTKLDWIHYKKGAQYNMGADLKIDVVFDVYSERILGYYCGTEHENYTQHFSAFKMAISESLTKPALVTYDNQGGHKTQEMQELYDNVITSNGGEHYPHRANEHGSPVEQLFRRFQAQTVNTVWWSDKQAITVRTEDSRPNMDFIKRFRHKLMTTEECIEAFSYYVEKWNKAEHPLFEKQSRNEVYGHEATYELDKINELDLMRLFWVTSKDTITYTNSGIKPTIRKEEYHFEVYDADGNVDIDFRDNYTGCKFYYQYDPNQLDSFMRLYLKLPNGDSKYIADAQPIKKVRNIPALMNDQDKANMHKMRQVRDKELSQIEEELSALRHRTNITEESLIEQQNFELKHRGKIPKEKRTAAEAGAGSWTSKL